MLNVLPSTSPFLYSKILVVLCFPAPRVTGLIELDTRVKQKILFFIDSISFSWDYESYSFLNFVFRVSC